MTQRNQPRYVARGFWEELKRQGRTIRWLARETGMHETTVSLMKAGQRPILEPFVLAACRAIDVDAASFFVRVPLRDASDSDAERTAAYAAGGN